MRLLKTFLAGCVAIGAAILPARADSVYVSVTAPQDMREVPVTVLLPKNYNYKPAAGTRISGRIVDAQTEPAENGQTRVTFIAHDLKAGIAHWFFLDTTGQDAPDAGVELKRDGDNVNFFVKGKLLTRYDVTTGPNKPFFYPLNAPGGGQIVRHWPVETPGGETTDHPHHRGLWFTHGKVNGVDFWTEVGKVGKTVHTGYEEVRSGPVYGLMRAKTDWVKPDGKKIAEDVRELRVYNVSNGALMDFSVTVKAVGEPMVWGDTKEGTFALRLADSMRVAVEKGKVAEGHIVNSNDLKDAATWGKAADWCDYYGPIDGKIVGVAIFDDLKNPRHPTTWHVRDYGLFAANPFGLHDFDKKNPEGSGDLTVPEGQSLTFRYRLFLHAGTTQEANVAAVWQAFSAPVTTQIP